MHQIGDLHRSICVASYKPLRQNFGELLRQNTATGNSWHQFSIISFPSN